MNRAAAFAEELAVDLPVARRWGQLSAALGHHSADLLIAATALDPWQGAGGAANEREHPGAALPLQQRERAK